MGKIVLLTIVSLVLTACQGGQESAKQPAPAAAEKSSPSDAAGIVGKALEKMTDPRVTGCLDKVRAKEFAAALPLCLEAAKVDPGNRTVQSALDQARAGAGNIAAMKRQAEDSLAGMRDAQKAAGEAKKAFPSGVPKMP